MWHHGSAKRQLYSDWPANGSLSPLKQPTAVSKYTGPVPFPQYIAAGMFARSVIDSASVVSEERGEASQEKKEGRKAQIFPVRWEMDWQLLHGGGCDVRWGLSSWGQPW